jgi:hypothetical protein
MWSVVELPSGCSAEDGLETGGGGMPLAGPGAGAVQRREDRAVGIAMFRSVLRYGPRG